jgi:hypothetical protein
MMNDGINDMNLSMNQSTKYPNNQNELSVSQETLSNGYEYTKIMNHNQSSKRRKLILHFDNRNTLQVNFILFYFYFILLFLFLFYKVANNVSATTIEQGL